MTRDNRRDLFAAAALQGLLAAGTEYPLLAAETAADVARAMLRELDDLDNEARRK